MNNGYTIISNQCIIDNSTDCFFIPGNPDFSGIGVRVAFYVQSFTNGAFGPVHLAAVEL